jgi:signal transduction histidine kinase
MARDGKARLVVADQGIGIAPDRLPHIFERFERGVSVKSYGGLGLGLYITLQIVEAHGGSIRVESTPGRGSIFTVEFPCRRAGSSPTSEVSRINDSGGQAHEGAADAVGRELPGA